MAVGDDEYVHIMDVTCAYFFDDCQPGGEKA